MANPGIAATVALYRALVGGRLSKVLPDDPVGAIEAAWEEVKGSWTTEMAKELIPVVARHATGIPDQAIKAAAESLAEDIGEYLHGTSRDAVVQGLNQQLAQGIGDRVAWTRSLFGLGLDAPQTRSYLNAAGKNPEGATEIINLPAMRNAERMVAQRAERIADNEEHTVSQISKVITWRIKEKAGLIEPGSLVRWVTARDERVCPTCGPLHKKTVKMGEAFEVPGGGRIFAPGIHPNCRCRIIILKPKNLVEKSLKLADGDWDPYDRDRSGKFAEREMRTAVKDRLPPPPPIQTTTPPEQITQVTTQVISPVISAVTTAPLTQVVSPVVAPVTHVPTLVPTEASAGPKDDLNAGELPRVYVAAVAPFNWKWGDLPVRGGPLSTGDVDEELSSTHTRPHLAEGIPGDRDYLLEPALDPFDENDDPAYAEAAIGDLRQALAKSIVDTERNQDARDSLVEEFLKLQDDITSEAQQDDLLFDAYTDASGYERAGKSGMLLPMSFDEDDPGPVVDALDDAIEYVRKNGLARQEAQPDEIDANRTMANLHMLRKRAVALNVDWIGEDEVVAPARATVVVIDVTDVPALEYSSEQRKLRLLGTSTVSRGQYHAANSPLVPASIRQAIRKMAEEELQAGYSIDPKVQNVDQVLRGVRVRLDTGWSGDRLP
jgi:Phage Mu protein F like protein